MDSSAMRSVWVPWSLALKEGVRLLDDLSRYSRVNRVEMLDFLSSIERASYGEEPAPARRILPSNEGLDLPIVDEGEYKGAAEFMRTAKVRGFEIACNAVPLWLGTDKLRASSLVDVNGRRLTGPGDFPVYGCPNDPEVVRYGESMTRRLVESWPDMDVMALNHLEYPHILVWAYPRVDLESMFACFCDSCKKSAEEQGLEFERMRGEAKALLGMMSSRRAKSASPEMKADDVLNFLLRNPRIVGWLRFRMDSMTRYARALLSAGRDAAREFNPGLRFGLEFQLPSLSPILGTDYLALASDLDIMIPKFPDYLPGSVLPLFAREVASRTGVQEDGLLRSLRQAVDVGPGPSEYEEYPDYPELSHILLYSNAFDYSVVRRQMKYIEPLLDGRAAVQPYIWESNNDCESLRKKIEALAELGFKDFFLWNWEEGLSTQHLKELHGIL